jgi:hypothetical protein
MLYPMAWKDDIIAALQGLGGEADLANIYEEVHLDRPRSQRHWRSSIRRTLQMHNPDSKHYYGEEPFFHRPSKGRWGLRRAILIARPSGNGREPSELGRAEKGNGWAEAAPLRLAHLLHRQKTEELQSSGDMVEYPMEADIERLLEPGCTELPACSCGKEMHITQSYPLSKNMETHIRVYNCPGCNRELRLTVWGAEQMS